MSQKFATVSIIGKPNVGKSTLLNKILQQKLTIVTPKTQTTRTVINGILTQEDTQLVFTDTPGIFTPKKHLDSLMLRATWKDINNNDFILVLITPFTFEDTTKTIINKILKKDKKIIITINKIDLSSSTKLHLLINDLKTIYPQIPVFEISATKGIGISSLINYLTQNSHTQPWLYPEKQITTSSLRFLCAEITREQLFLQLHQEIPYFLTVITREWMQKEDTSIIIRQDIIIEKQKHKQIILGKNGEIIKKIGIQARINIEKAFNIKIHLFLSVLILVLIN